MVWSGVAKALSLQLLKDSLAFHAKFLGQHVDSNAFCQNRSPKNPGLDFAFLQLIRIYRRRRLASFGERCRIVVFIVRDGVLLRADIG